MKGTSGWHKPGKMALMAALPALLAVALAGSGDAPKAGAQTNAAADAEAERRLAATCRAEGLREIVEPLGGGTIRPIANGPQFADGIRFVAAAGGVPAYCQVTGSFVTNPATGKTANFLGTLPANWNGKFLQLGCGGHCGIIAGFINNAADPANVGSQQGSPLQSLRRGYASFGTDQGHEGN
ncbi:MAG: tannase/feruloyl esterase family alpha/beta hydrolase, partial [Novosphingobium sp.]|nr:tannase/feruloyl esterase family alpha/beta hydrolase [Novosphingobium sp.]